MTTTIDDPSTWHTNLVTVSTLRDRRDANIFELVAHQAALRPDAPAILVPGTGTTTYAQLVARATAIADDLVARGLEPEETVGVLLHRTSDLVATMLGVLRAGGAYVPMDPTDPIERSRRMFSAAGCRRVIGHAGPLAALRDAITAHDEAGAASNNNNTNNTSTAPHRTEPEFLDIDRLGRDPDVAPSPCAPGGSRLAYILFTSGSTGAPKGVEIEHANIAWLLQCAEEMLAFTAEDRYLATATVAFDISVTELYLPLVTGGSFVLRDRDLLLRPRELAATIAGHGVTVFQTGPSLWKVILDELPDFPHLRVAVLTGEATPPSLARRMVPVADRVWNVYGPTETTVWCSGMRVELPPIASDGLSTVAASIGFPMTDVEMIVVDDDNQPVPDGTHGELLLGGPCVGRGYYGNPTLTAERFITLPDGRRYYRSGDVGERAADGSFAFHGRNDDQIKVRGVRIEPMEIEETILADPCVERVAATWFPTAGGNRGLVAAVVCGASTPTTAAELQERLSKVLPVQMVPSRYLFCDTLPRTPSGKIDRVAIRAMATGDGATTVSVDDTDQMTSTERTLARLWRQVLGIASVSRHDHFFSIGGDSLAAVTLMLDVEDAFGIVLPVQLLFDAPTLSELAARIDESVATPADGLTAPSSDFVFPLVTGGRGRPIFFASADVKLAKKGTWTLDCPLYAITYWALGKGFMKAASIEDMAAQHVEAVRSVQPQGPYRLAGHSFGGFVAVEMARQLRAAGQEVELLFLLDPTQPFRTSLPAEVATTTAATTTSTTTTGSTTGAPAAATVSPRRAMPVHHDVDAERLTRRIRRHARHVASHPRELVPYVRDKVRHVPDVVLGTTKAGPSLSRRLFDLYLKHPNAITQRLLPSDRWPAFWYAAEQLAKDHVVHPYDGPVLAIFLEQHNEREPIWRPLLPQLVAMRRIDTTHAMLSEEPALSTWMRFLEDHLDAHR